MLPESCWLVLLLLWGLLWLAWTWRYRTCAPSETTTVTACVQRLLKPRTPDDCPACRRQSALPVANTPPPSAVTPWCEVKSRRGAPKRINTHGFACPNHACPYYRISDAQVHALVGDGVYGRHQRIQTLRCQACHTTFSTRRDTPL